MPSINSELVAKILLIRKLRKKLKREPREVSIRPIFLNRSCQGDSILIQELQSDPLYHQRYFRMNRESFNEILNHIEDDIGGCRTHARPISPTEKLALTLRYLASGNSQISMSMSYRISPSSISKILRHVLQVIIEKLGPKYLLKPTQEMWEACENGFRTRWNFPNCFGAVDGKHCRIQAPNFSGSQYFNYKGYFSIVLMAVVDHTYKFTLVDIGASGSQSDGGVFSRSEIGKRLENGTLFVPPPKNVGPNNDRIPHFLVADDAFPLKTYILKPFPGKFLEQKRRIFNYRLSRARNVVENSFGILSNRWRIFQTPIIAELDLTKLIVHATVILHNFLQTKQDTNNITVDRYQDGTLIPGSWRSETANDTGLVGLRQQGSNNYGSDASEIRNFFAEYFSGEGQVEWQLSRIS